MRVVGGYLRSRIIKAPEVDSTRPTSDKTRESIFNMLNFYVAEANVLDIFSGSGALGIEAISRGAKKVSFIDNNEIAIKTIKENLATLKINDKALIYQDDYKIIATFKEKFDIVLLDPPYALDCFNDVFNLLINNDLLNDNCIIIYESDVNNTLKDIPSGFTYKVKKYGIAYVNVLKKE